LENWGKRFGKIYLACLLMSLNWRQIKLFNDNNLDKIGEKERAGRGREERREREVERRGERGEKEVVPLRTWLCPCVT